MTRYATLLIIIALISTFSIAQSLHWTQISPATTSRPPARDNGALAWTPSALYVFGGEGVDGVLGDTWKFSLFNNSWTELSFTTKPSARYGFLAGKLGNDYWYISHGRYDNDMFSDTWAFHFDSKTWTQVNTTGENGDSQSVPEARYFAAGGSNVASLSSNDTTGSLWLSMGINKASRKLSDTWILTINFSNPLQGIWKKVSSGVGLNQYNPTLPHARSQAAGIPFSEGRFVLSGGCASGGQAGGPCPLEDSWVFDSSNNLWSRLPSCTIPALSSSLVPLNLQLSDIAVLYGGTQKGPGALSQALSATPLSDDELTLINISSLQWIRINVRNTSSLLPTVRSGSQLATGALGVYMFGGKAITNDNLLNDAWLLQGDGSNVEVISCTYTWFSSVHLHGIIMYIAWGLLLPFGALMGRYYRWSWPVWFAIHIPCQVIGTLLTFGGFILIFLVSTQPSFPHGVIGTILTAIIAQQFLTGIFHPCAAKENGRYLEESKNKDTFKYKWRQCWEVYHAVSGIISIALGFTQVTLGVFLINAPSIVWAVWVGLLCVWLLVFLFHEIFYWCCKKYLKD